MDGRPALCIQSPPFQSGPDLDICKDASVPRHMCPALLFPPNLRGGCPSHVDHQGHLVLATHQVVRGLVVVQTLRPPGRSAPSETRGWDRCHRFPGRPRWLGRAARLSAPCLDTAAVLQPLARPRELPGPLGPRGVRVCISATRPGTGVHSVSKTPLDCMAVDSSMDTKSYRAQHWLSEDATLITELSSGVTGTPAAAPRPAAPGTSRLGSPASGVAAAGAPAPAGVPATASS